MGIDIEEGDFDTIGGWMLTENFDVKQGDIISFGSYLFNILEMEEHHIKYIEVTLQQTAPEGLGNQKDSNNQDEPFSITKTEVLS